MPAATARRRIMRQASDRFIGCSDNAVAQVAHGFGRYGVEKFAPVGGVERRRLAGFNDMLLAAHG
jgi:hypothetical protein